MAAERKSDSGPPDLPYYTKAEINRYLHEYALSHQTDNLRLRISELDRRVSNLEEQMAQVNNRIGINPRGIDNFDGGRKKKRKTRRKKRKSHKKIKKRRKKRTKRRR